MFRLTVLLLLAGSIIHSNAEAFPAGLLDGLSNIANGTYDLTDICGVLFIPCVVTLVLTKREWLKVLIALVWSVDLLIDSAYWLHHFVATGILVLATLFLRWLYRKMRISRV